MNPPSRTAGERGGSALALGTVSRRAFVRGAGASLVAAQLGPRWAQAQPAYGDRSWTVTTRSTLWQAQPLRTAGAWQPEALDLHIGTEPAGPSIEGFGACFNELGWMALAALADADREAILRELFEPGIGANFTYCRMPIGANDFARRWYSFDETPDDFALAHFSIANDRETLIPFIHAAQRHQPQLRLWASPWSPPSWMKTNRFYAEAEPFPGWVANGIRPDQVRHEGQDVFRQEPRYLEAYAQYFGRFIDAYRQEGIPVGMVMPQNEFNSAQAFPSCTWTPEGLARLLEHLGPAMQSRGVAVFFGTLERGNSELLERVLADAGAAAFLQGVGVQWAGKNALATIRQQHPQLKIIGSEQECGDGKNDWSYAGYCWRLMKSYLDAGASAYMYWNLALTQGGLSHWGWAQNSLVTVDAATRTFRWNHEYFILKHVSHYVQNGAQRLPLGGTCNDALAFRNPDGSVAVVLRQEGAESRPVDVHLDGAVVSVTLPPDSVGTLHLHQGQ